MFEVYLYVFVFFLLLFILRCVIYVMFMFACCFYYVCVFLWCLISVLLLCFIFIVICLSYVLWLVTRLFTLSDLYYIYSFVLHYSFYVLYCLFYFGMTDSFINDFVYYDLVLCLSWTFVLLILFFWRCCNVSWSGSIWFIIYNKYNIYRIHNILYIVPRGGVLGQLKGNTRVLGPT